MSSFDRDLLRIAAKLAVIQRVAPVGVVVPRTVALVVHDLDNTRAIARKVLRRDRLAGEQLIAMIGGNTPLPWGSHLESRRLSPRAAALLGQAGRAPIEGLPCQGYAAGDMDMLQAAFLLDAAHAYRDARLTMRTARYIRERRNVIAMYERLIDRQAAGIPTGTMVPTSGAYTLDGEGGEPVVGTMVPGQGSYPLFPPGTDVPDPGDPATAPNDDLCCELSDLCAQLFNDFVAASLAQEDSQLIASVEPDCLCADDVNEKTVFTARPEDKHPFPHQQGDYRLIFRSADITDRIRNWSTKEIRFTIPAGSSTGYVRLQRFANSASAGLGRTLSNLCGVPNLGAHGADLSPSPRAIISIIRPPVIDSFTINGVDNPKIHTEACTALRLNWSVRLADQQAGQVLPPCSSIQIELRDADGALLHASTDAIGSWLHNPDTDTRYRLIATSLANNRRCGQTKPIDIHVVREHRVYVEPNEPATPTIVAGKTGSLKVRLSCPAPAAGARVELQSSDVGILRLPDSALIFPGETSTVVQFATERDHNGGVVITARLANHQDGVLNYDVVANLTAIVLSGGGAKGSFEVGALLYLREIWDSVKPTIICGTSVGAINALGVAENVDGSGIDKIERIWLALEKNSDMYGLSPEFKRASDILGVSLADVALHGVAIPSFINLYLSLVNLSPETAAWAGIGWAVGGPLGGVVAGAVQLFVDSPEDKVSDAINEIKAATYIYDLTPTQQKIEDNIDRDRVANSGMKLRLALVSLNDGDLYYVTESAHLLRGHAFNASFDEAIINNEVVPPGILGAPFDIPYPGIIREPLIAGTMASAAIPAIFQARPIFTTSTMMYYVDGGVRQVLPAQAAVELGAQLIFDISTSPIAPTPAPGAGQSFGGPGMLFPIALRGIDLQGNEVAVSNETPRAGFCDQRERVPIQPAFEVHDTTQIDPGLIRINMAYGYFRAFDADQRRRGTVNAIQYIIWLLWTDDLIQTRLDCHRLESGIPAAIAARGGFFDHSLLQLIRTKKNHTAELVVQRFEQFGVDAFPRTLRSGTLGDQSVLDWMGTWEVHQDPLRTFLDSVDLWTPQIIAPGQVSDDPTIPAAPPVREADVIGQFPLPDPVRDALRFR